MFPWGAIIGLAGQAVSGALSAVNNRNMQQASDAEAARQQAFYNAKANENPLSRSEVQHVLGQYDRSAQQQIENARGVSAIKGMTPEFELAVQKGLAEGRANLMGNVAANASARKDRYEQMGEMVKHQQALDDQRRRYERNQTYAALAANAASAVGSIMDGYSAQKAPAAKTASAGNEGAAKIATSIPESVKNLSVQTSQLSADPFGKDAVGFLPNGDGTFTKDGAKYIQNPDGSYKLIF